MFGHAASVPDHAGPARLGVRHQRHATVIGSTRQRRVPRSASGYLAVMNDESGDIEPIIDLGTGFGADDGRGGYEAAEAVIGATA